MMKNLFIVLACAIVPCSCLKVKVEFASSVKMTNNGNNGKIATPEEVTLSTGDPGSLTVYWTLSNGQTPDDGYIVYWTCGNITGNAGVDGSDTSYTITGLPECQQCSVSVTLPGSDISPAEEEGFSGPSAPVLTPMNVEALSLDCDADNVSVTWEYESSEVNSFTVDWICPDGKFGSQKITGSFQTNLTGLSSECKITVAGFNCAGTGPTSEPVTITVGPSLRPHLIPNYETGYFYNTFIDCARVIQYDDGPLTYEWICQNGTGDSLTIDNPSEPSIKSSIILACNVTLTNSRGESWTSLTFNYNDRSNCPDGNTGMFTDCTYSIVNRFGTHDEIASFCSQGPPGFTILTVKSLLELEIIQEMQRGLYITHPVHTGLYKNMNDNKWYWNDTGLEQPVSDAYWDMEAYGNGTGDCVALDKGKLLLVPCTSQGKMSCIIQRGELE